MTTPAHPAISASSLPATSAPAFPVPLIGGEIHYGRVQQRYWPQILESARTLGAEVIGAYVMWDFHEIGEGRYDFALLHEFLAEVDRRGFRVLARPGPYFYAEWRNLGIPDHAVPFGKAHPTFRAKAAAWIAAVMHELRPYLGRLIIAVQADNEIDPMPHFYGEDQGFADWLRRRYADVSRLNAAWNTSYESFAEPVPWLAAQLATAGGRGDARVDDSCQYRYDLATDYARWVIAQYRAAGCDVPILLNTWPGVDAQHWRDLAELADFYGIDPYPTNECATDFRYFRERLRLLRSVTSYPYIAEFGAGVWHGMPNRGYSPEHYRLAALAALASGVRGWNWYMLVNRDNWQGSPINERGVIRPELGPAFVEAVRDFHTLRDAPRPEVSFGVAWSWRYHQLAQIAKRDVDDPLPAVLHDVGVEYDWIDVDRDFRAILPPAEYAASAGPAGDIWPDLLLYCGDSARGGPLSAGGPVDRSSTAASLPARLLRYVESGGRLILFQRLIAGCATPDGTSHAGAENLEISLPLLPGLASTASPGGGPITFVTHNPIFAYRRIPVPPVERSPAAARTPIFARQLPWRVDDDQRRLMELAVGRAYMCGYHERCGAGSITVLGCAPSRDALLALHAWLGRDIPALPLTAGVHATKRGDRLIVLNRESAKTARIRLEGREISVDLSRCGGAIVNI